MTPMAPEIIDGLLSLDFAYIRPSGISNPRPVDSGIILRQNFKSWIFEKW